MLEIKQGDTYQLNGNYGFTTDAHIQVLEVRGSQETGLAVCKYLDSDDDGVLGWTNTFGIGLNMLRSKVTK